MKKVITPAKDGSLTEAIKEVVEQQQIQLPKPVTRESFKTDEEFNAFLEFTKPIHIRKLPKMPFTKLGDYLKEYNLIMINQSRLSGTQRMVVKNVINNQIRIGNIELTTE